MTTPTTETISNQALGLDTLPGTEVLQRILAGQITALQAVTPAIPALNKGAVVIAEALRGEGRLAYAGAGSSALMTNADGMELAGTFGIDPARILLFMAGGLPRNARMTGDTEDDIAQAERDAATLTAQDVLVAVSASGSTPYTLHLAERAKSIGAHIIAIANNPDTPLLLQSDVAICLPTPPEVVPGSTRLGAGTAQKAALNMMSTLACMELGHIYDGMMVNLCPDNEKLRQRATLMVERIADATPDAAARALAASNWSVKAAAVMLKGAMTLEQANAALIAKGGHLRRVFSALKSTGSIASATNDATRT